ncbi:MAG: FAD binding domain-containing protein [Candidatus Asgardarchaeia archaeon]
MEVLDIKTPEFLTPTTEDELYDILDTYKEKAKVLAGGSDLLLLMRKGVIKPEVIVNIMEIQSLKFIEENEKEVRIGATCTYSEIIENEIIKTNFPELVEAIKKIASTPIRNRATMAGNLANASPAADSAPILIVLGAKLKLKSKEGEREVPVEDFFLGVRKTVLKPNEIIREIIIPKKAKNFEATFYKLGKRNALVLAVVSTAVSIKLSENGTIEDARIALGSVAPVPLRAKKAEEVIKGKVPTLELIEECAKVAMNESKPISDVRASAEYRKEMVFVLTRRVLINTLKKLGVELK